MKASLKVTVSFIGFTRIYITYECNHLVRVGSMLDGYLNGVRVFRLDANRIDYLDVWPTSGRSW